MSTVSLLSLIKLLPDCIQAIRFELLEDIQPQLRHGHPLIMELSGVDEHAFAIDDCAVGVPLDKSSESVIACEQNDSNIQDYTQKD
jgi:hypothetical protein